LRLGTLVTLKDLLHQISDNKLLFFLFSSIVGALIAALFTAIRNKLTRLGYSVSHERVGLSAEDRIFANVRITWIDHPVTNLYTSTVRLENSTTHDVSDLKVKIFTGGETILLTERTEIVGTSYIVQWSPEYANSVRIQDGEQPTEFQDYAYRHQREYLLPALNRGMTASFTFLTTVPNGTQGPSVWLDVLETGVVAKYRPPTAFIHGVPVPIALSVGLIAVAVICIVSIFFIIPWVGAVVCVLAGLTVQSIGAALVHAFKAARKVVSH
jgi:hypothetical protein